MSNDLIERKYKQKTKQTKNKTKKKTSFSGHFRNFNFLVFLEILNLAKKKN